MKTLWKTACTAVCLCALIISMTGCAQSSDSGDEPFFPDETPAEFSTIRIQVTDSIGGTVVSGTTLNVYKSGTTEQIGSGYTVTNGKVMLTISRRISGTISNLSAKRKNGPVPDLKTGSRFR